MRDKYNLKTSHIGKSPGEFNLRVWEEGPSAVWQLLGGTEPGQTQFLGP